MAPRGCFLTAHPESWVALEVGSDAACEALCEVSGLAASQDDERFGDGGTQDALDVVERLQARGVVAAPSYRMDQVAGDEHLRSRSALRRYRCPPAAAPDGPSRGRPARPRSRCAA